MIYEQTENLEDDLNHILWILLTITWLREQIVLI